MIHVFFLLINSNIIKITFIIVKNDGIASCVDNTNHKCL